MHIKVLITKTDSILYRIPVFGGQKQMKLTDDYKFQHFAIFLPEEIRRDIRDHGDHKRVRKEAMAYHN